MEAPVNDNQGKSDDGENVSLDEDVEKESSQINAIGETKEHNLMYGANHRGQENEQTPDIMIEAVLGQEPRSFDLTVTGIMTINDLKREEDKTPEPEVTLTPRDWELKPVAPD